MLKLSHWSRNKLRNKSRTWINVIKEMCETPSSILPSVLLSMPKEAGPSKDELHWKKNLLNTNFGYRKCNVKDNEIFLSPFLTWPSKPCHFVVYYLLICNYRSCEISDDCLIKLCQQFDLLVVMIHLSRF